MVDRRYKFRVGEKAIVTADIESKARQKPRRGALQHIEPEYPGRRHSPLIRFYDLAQVNHEALSDAPVWVDHPILKTPSYSTSAIISTADFFQGVKYSVEPFVDSDHQAFTELIFTYAVTEWTRRYRRVELPTDFEHAEDFTLDARISMVDEGPTNELFLASLELKKSWPIDYPALRESYLSTNHWAYSLDRQGSIRRGLQALILNNQAYTGTEFVTAGYFPCNTVDKTRFKITATNDSSAADVGDLTPAGIIDVFMMPQIGFTLGTSNSSDWATTEVLGLCYQVMPRYRWPLYVTPNVRGSGDQWGSDSDVSNYIDYLTFHRSGMQLSVWSFTGALNTPFDYAYSETAFAPSDWTGQSKWALAHSGGLANSYYGMQSRSGPFNDSRTSFATFIEADSVDDYYSGLDLFRNYSPFLTCVFKMGGQYYYVWDVSGNSGSSIGNYSTDETQAQGSRFRLSRGVVWDGETISTTPSPRDGSGPSWDVQNDFP
jgi:hypothetical protein